MGLVVHPAPGQSFESYNPPEIACGEDRRGYGVGWALGAWSKVDEDGNMVPFKNGLPRWNVCACAVCSTQYGNPLKKSNPEMRREQKRTKQKYVFAGLLNEEQEKEWRAAGGAFDPASRMGLEESRYNFATGIWVSIDGNRKYKNGERVE